MRLKGTALAEAVCIGLVEQIPNLPGAEAIEDQSLFGFRDNNGLVRVGGRMATGG